MTQIKFGTDGWRAIIAKEYTVENVARVTLATAQWLNEKYNNPSVVIGYDCRFGGKMFAETSAKVLASKGIKVYLSSEFASTPMVSLGVVKKETSIGVVITASHNPPEYNGFKLKGSYGGPMLTSDVDDIEKIIPEVSDFDVNTAIEPFVENGSIEYIDLEDMYIKHAESVFDLDAIRNSDMSFAYDAMYGAGQNVMRTLFPEATFLHCDDNPGFDGQAPEPIDKNLQELSETIKAAGDIDFGLATDGDADRIGLYNAKGKFIDSHHIILLLIHYLVKHKGMTGKVAVSFSCTDKIKELCQQLGLEAIITKIGFKYIPD
mgnify:CR=1 FL=1